MNALALGDAHGRDQNLSCSVFNNKNLDAQWSVKLLMKCIAKLENQ